MWWVLPPGFSPAVADARRHSAVGSYHAPALFHNLLHTLLRDVSRDPDHAALAPMGNCTWRNFGRSAGSRGISEDRKRQGRGT